MVTCYRMWMCQSGVTSLHSQNNKTSPALIRKHTEDSLKDKAIRRYRLRKSQSASSKDGGRVVWITAWVETFLKYKNQRQMG